MAQLPDIDRLDTVLRLSDDGYIMLDAQSRIADMNDEAARMLAVQPGALIGQTISSVNIALGSWRTLLEAVQKGVRTDINLVVASGRRVLVSLRRRPHTDHIALIKLCDLENFDYRRQMSEGDTTPRPSGFLAGNKTRPDFEAQRRLCSTLHKVLSRGERAMQRGARVLITGESGVGKSEIARFLHGGVARGSDAFISINCAMISPHELDRMLFGSNDGEDSAFFRAAGGTLFLDEVAELSLSAQARLVGHLEDNTLDFHRGAGAVQIGPRLITATNRDLQELVQAGKFRADLYYRLAVIRLAVPPLRDMPELIEHLIQRFLLTINRRRKEPVAFPDRLLRILEDYSFPGNIRELLNIVQRGAIFTEDADDMAELTTELLTLDPVPPDRDVPNTGTFDLKTEVRRFERALIDRAIQAHGSKRKAAKALGVDIGTISRKTTDDTPA
ncbi:Transcriptional regulator containing PAS, AAA-type ATPase, and DNA-binding Fis domains [Nitratireductor aquibiodomus]|uniref:HTH-type transcriptional regulatory protein TyrR n=1 Tax=Nitratireductor aquibiodomus TaxID=204799 RepID=A0A1H4JDG9_9HYPH|nr:sigma 54-interacting transcriptional regulator [Nitratireductor aquibiodomus]SEB44036.1 Transcriptional regulator containing PAS, AAA-type ATPase, and DNA-binding Fis domains [Nitratireductor aquibiodomus]